MKEILINHGGWSHKRRGYTLIELISVISISTIVMFIGVTLIISSYKNYINIKESAIKEDEIDNVLLTIDRLLTENMIKKIDNDITNNKIEITYLIEYGKEDEKKKVIRKDAETLVVESMESLNIKNTRVILEKVNEFIIIKKGNLYYYKIMLKDGRDIIRCM